MQNIKIFALDFIKGIIIGFGAIVPGVSGGTAAVALGIFGDILEAVANILKHFKRSIIRLTPIIMGVVLGVYIISSPLNYFCEEFPRASKVLFIIISSFSAFVFYKKELWGRFKKSNILWMIFGMGISCATNLIIDKLSNICNGSGSLYLLLCGIPLSLALILPAISFSYMMLSLGLYESAVKAISEFDVPFLFPLFFGVLIGGLIFSKVLLGLTERFKIQTYSFVLGFVIISLIDILL